MNTTELKLPIVRDVIADSKFESEWIDGIFERCDEPHRSDLLRLEIDSLCGQMIRALIISADAVLRLISEYDARQSVIRGVVIESCVIYFG